MTIRLLNKKSLKRKGEYSLTNDRKFLQDGKV